jgi:type IV pilus assembly protein PilY1
VVVDVDNDFKADYVYAGDLFGNLWKFDVRSTNPSNWDVAYKNGTANLPLFTATSDVGGLQPITTRPQVTRHPSGNGLIVLFGTGKYFEVGDNRSAGQETQSVYGIWDRPNVPPTASREILRDHLLEQTIDYELAVGGVGYRGTSANTLVWFVKPLCTTGVTPPACDADGLPVTDEGSLGWFMDLDSPDSGANRGERQVSDMLLRGDKLIFTTLLPLDDTCAFGGDGWLMEIDAESGGRLGYSPFDVNGDGLFTTSDLIDFDGAGSSGGANPAVAASGRKSGVGIIPTPAILARGAGDATKYVAGSKGGQPVGVRNIDKHLGRQSWQQLLR